MSNKFFSEIKKNFGFGCMRLPMKDNEVDYAEFTKMVDTFIENGFNYFDTAHGYVSGKSETALKDCLTSRYPRSAYILTDKLSTHHFDSQEEIRPLFESQLAACGVEYFDFYLMHAQDANIYEKYKKQMENQVSEEVVKEGFDKLLKVVQDTARKRAALLQGQIMEALVEEVNEQDESLMTGRLSNNMLVHFPADRTMIGQLVKVSLDTCHGFYYTGHIV